MTVAVVSIRANLVLEVSLAKKNTKKRPLGLEVLFGLMLAQRAAPSAMMRANDKDI